MSKFLNLEGLQYYHDKLSTDIKDKFDEYKEKLVVISEVEPDDDINRVWVNAGTVGEVELVTSADFDSYSTNLITTSETQPTHEYNKIWIEPGAELIAIPTMEDFEELQKTVQSNSIRYVQDYLYEIDYNNIDWEFGKKFLQERYTNAIGACSSVRKDNFYGRNYDWYYDNTAYFIIRVSKSKDVKYSSVGMTGGFPTITDEFVKSGEYNEIYKVLPFITLDGINEKGVIANLNVVPTGDMGITTGTVPTISKQDTICVMSIVRYILDNFATASEAVNYIKQYVSIYAPNKTDGLKQELHVMVADSTDTYLIEFVSNEIIVTNMDTELNGRTYMTNFYLQGTTVDSNNHINFSSVTPYGCGLERYNVISDNINTVNSVSTMTQLMQKIKYTNAYQSSTDPIWKTEFVDKEHNLTVTTDISQFMDIITRAREGYPNRQRNGVYWQTCHSSVYDIQNKLMYLIVQEQPVDTQTEITIVKGVDTTSLVGQKTAEGGEIFNDYTHNKASSLAHAEGNRSSALGIVSHSEGNSTCAYGDYSHTEGYSSNNATDKIPNISASTSNEDIISTWNTSKFTLAKGDHSHAEGDNTLSLGARSHSEGERTIASGTVSHAEGHITVASGMYAHSQGNNTTASGQASHSEGTDTTASGNNSHAGGNKTTAMGNNSYAEGDSNNKATQYIDTDSDKDTIINAWGTNKFSLAKGNSSHIEGSNNLALDDYTHAEGTNTIASGYGAKSEGCYTVASGDYSHAQGFHTKASGNQSTAVGNYTTASGQNSFAEGDGTIASGLNSHTSGAGTIANSDDQFVTGKFNTVDNNNKFAFIVGNGNNTNVRSNAFAVGWDGKLYTNNSTEGITIQPSQDITLEEYLAMTPEQQNNGTYWYIIES